MRLISALIFLTVGPSTAHAFPEMIRHKYSNCTTCHVSPSGGGVLTQYGRELSREVLSSWGTEKESRFLYLVEQPEWLNLGGDFRWIQTFRETSAASSGMLIRMQSDLEAAATLGKFTLVQSFGYEPTRSATGVQGGGEGGEFFSRRQYLLFKPNDATGLRVGKFFLPYGLNLPDHVVTIKRGLGWDEGSETVNVEGSYIGESWNVFLSGSLGRPDSKFLNREKGASLVVSRLLGETFKVGASYFYGWNTLPSGVTDKRHVFGPWLSASLGSHLYLLAELDFQRDTISTNPSAVMGMVDFARLGYEIFKGVHVYAQQEYSQLNFDAPTSKYVAYTAGMLLYPRPHFEFHLAWQKSKAPATSTSYNDLAWILFHFYP